MQWHVDDRDRDIDTLTPAIGGLQWGFNAPGCFMLARVLEHGRVYPERDLSFQYKTVPDVVDEIKKVIADRNLPKYPVVYASADLFQFTDPKEGVSAEPIALVFARCGLPLVPVHGDPAFGWQRVQGYLREAPDGLPWLIVGPKCETLIRTLPTVAMRPNKPEEPFGQTFAVEALRQILSSRPSPSTLARQTPKYGWGTAGWLKRTDSKPRGTLSMD